MPSGASKCRDAICTDGVTVVVAPARSNTLGDKPVLHLFARAADGSWKQTSSGPGGGSYTGGWISRGGSFDSAPNAIAYKAVESSSWGGGPTISLFGISPATKRVLVKHIGLEPGTQTGFADISHPSNQTLGGVPPTVCTLGTGRVDTWLRVAGNKGGTLMHKAAEKEADWYNGAYEDSGAGDLISASRYSVVCRDSESSHDIVTYANDNPNGTSGGGSSLSVWHRQYKPTWGPWTNRGGDYAEGTHPVLLEVSARRFDFFGLGKDARLYHWSWESAAGYSRTEAMGSDTFASMPAAALAGPNSDRIEVVAVGKEDGKLKRFSLGLLDASPSAGKWEDLGVVAGSAPSLARVGPTAVEMVTAAADGSIWYASVNTANDTTNSWGKLAWSPIPGL